MTPATRPKPAPPPTFDVSAAVAAAESRRLAELGHAAQLEHEAREAARLAEEQRQTRVKDLLAEHANLVAGSPALKSDFESAMLAFQTALARSAVAEEQHREIESELSDLGFDVRTLAGVWTAHLLLDYGEQLPRLMTAFASAAGRPPRNQKAVIFYE